MGTNGVPKKLKKVPMGPVLEIKDRGEHGRGTQDILKGTKSWGDQKTKQLKELGSGGPKWQSTEVTKQQGGTKK